MREHLDTVCYKVKHKDNILQELLNFSVKQLHIWIIWIPCGLWFVFLLLFYSLHNMIIKTFYGDLKFDWFVIHFFYCYKEASTLQEIRKEWNVSGLRQITKREIGNKVSINHVIWRSLKQRILVCRYMFGQRVTIPNPTICLILISWHPHLSKKSASLFHFS